MVEERKKKMPLALFNKVIAHRVVPNIRSASFVIKTERGYIVCYDLFVKLIKEKQAKSNKKKKEKSKN